MCFKDNDAIILEKIKLAEQQIASGESDDWEDVKKEIETWLTN